MKQKIKIDKWDLIKIKGFENMTKKELIRFILELRKSFFHSVWTSIKLMLLSVFFVGIILTTLFWLLLGLSL